jgi:hypothetical protein
LCDERLLVDFESEDKFNLKIKKKPTIR